MLHQSELRTAPHSRCASRHGGHDDQRTSEIRNSGDPDSDRDDDRQGAERFGSGRLEFDLAIYAWLPTIEGKLAYDLPGLGDTIEIDPADLLENLEFTAMVAFAARRDLRWSVLGDVVYLQGGRKPKPDALDIGNETQPQGGFRAQDLLDHELHQRILASPGANGPPSGSWSVSDTSRWTPASRFSSDGPLDLHAPLEQKPPACGTALSACRAASGWRSVGMCPITWTSAPAIPTSRCRLCAASVTSSQVGQPGSPLPLPRLRPGRRRCRPGHDSGRL